MLCSKEIEIINTRGIAYWYMLGNIITDGGTELVICDTMDSGAIVFIQKDISNFYR